jgi:hypothetical protein
MASIHGLDAVYQCRRRTNGWRENGLSAEYTETAARFFPPFARLSWFRAGTISVDRY